MTTTPSCTFWLRFADQGPLQGSVDADDLAQSLAAVDDVFDCINKVATGGDITSSLRVDRGEQRDGFSVALTLTQEAAAQQSFLEVPSPDGTLTPQEAVQVLLQLIRLKRVLKGAKPLKAEPALLPGFVSVYTDLEHAEEVWEITLRCYENGDCAKALARLASPLRRGKGTTALTVAMGTDTQSLLTKEASSFTAATGAGDKNTTVSRTTVEVLAPSFVRDVKWRVKRGQTPLQAELLDEAFWQKIENRGIAFSWGDVLDVDLQITRCDEGGKLKTVYKMEKVYARRRPGTQEELI